MDLASAQPSATLLQAQMVAMRRIALAVARPTSDDLVAELVRELAGALDAAAAFVATFTDDTRQRLRTRGMWLDGRSLPDFEYELAGSPCERVVGRQFLYLPGGVLAGIDPDSDFAAAGLDAYAAFPLDDGQGEPLGVLAVMDRRPVASGDADHAEVLLKVAAGRLAAELERRDRLEALSQAAMAVSAATGDVVFEQLAGALARILRVDFAFVARFDPADPGHLTMAALCSDGQVQRELRYPVEPTPCRTVLGARFRAYPRNLSAQFPDDPAVRARGAESYAGHPLVGAGGEPLGVIAVGSRRPLRQLERVESMLKIFAVRAAAELERQGTLQALRRSEASYRTIFDSAEGAIFVHDWETFALLDVNARACEEHGRSRDELLRIDPAELMAGDAPFDMAGAAERLALARLDRCPPFEWKVRVRGGELRWWEIRLKPAQLDGRPCILAFTHDITDRKTAEARLRDSEAQYRAIFDASADALILWDKDYRRVDVNPAYERMYGWRRDEVVGRGFEVFSGDPAHVEPRRELVRRALAGETCRAELEGVDRAGQRIVSEIHTVPFRHRGEPHVLAIARDVTERTRAEAASRAREEQYRAIFDGSADQMVLWNRSLEVVDVNAAFERNTGLRRDEVVGRHWSARPDAESIRRLVPDVERALAGEFVQRFHSFTGPDGSPFEIELRYLPVMLGGEPYALGIGRDVTQRLAQERELLRSAAHLRATVEAAFDCVVAIDGDGRIVEFNAAAERVFGHGRGEAIGRRLGELIIPPQHRAAHERGLRRFAAHGAPSPMLGRLVETTALTADGREIPVEMAISVAAVPDGHIFVGHLRDISARRAAEAERAQLEAQLRQAQKMEAIGQLTGGIAHDFNNILTSVLGYVVLAQGRAEALADPRLQHQLTQAQRATERARDLIAQMLAFARRRPAARQPLAPGQLLRQTVQLLQPTLPSSVLIEVDADSAGLPGIDADAVQLEQVLVNLCINARDAIGGAGRIRLALRGIEGAVRCAACGAAVSRGRWLEVEVADNGSGIAPEVLARMFDPFYTTKPTGSGSGMGLAIVHGIVHDHGGHIGVETALGQGTTFRVWLPAAGGPGKVVDRGVADTRAATDRAGLRGRVLVVEDDPLVGEFLVEQLETWGLEVVLMRDPLAALAWIEDGANCADLLLTDLTMPHLNGLQLAEQVARVRPGLPVLMASGNLDAVGDDALAAAGLRAVLAKPVDPVALREALSSALVAPPGAA